MSSDVGIALIAAGASLVAGFVTGYFAPVLKAKRERRLEVEELHSRYRDALLRAAFDLQSRLYNILNGFLQSYHGRGERHRRYAEDSTMWLVGQYFGWVEAMRRDAQFLDVGSVRSARRLELALGRVRDAFGSDRKISDPLFLIFRVDQRAIGELMIDRDVVRDSRTRCVDYTEFCNRLNEEQFASHFQPLRDDVQRLVRVETPSRVLAIQHALIDLITLLDPKQQRFPDQTTRTKFDAANLR